MEYAGELEIDPCVRDVAEGGVLTMYLASGKKKHKRYFWVDVQSGLIMWDKKKRFPPNKVEQLVGVDSRPAVRDAREWFGVIDADGSGQLNSDELATLYRRATGEKLSKKQLKQAMHEMDTDGSGAISFEEFSKWWYTNGGDLEKHRDLALTVQTVEVTLLLVAQDADTKRRWVQGLTAVLRLLGEMQPQAPDRVSRTEGFGGLAHPEAWFQCQTAKTRDGTQMILAHGIPVMVAVLPQGVEVRKEATGELVAAIRRGAIHSTQLTRKGLLVYVTDGLSGSPLPEGSVQVLALDTDHAEEMEEQLAFIGAGMAARSPESGGTGMDGSALPPPSPSDVIDDAGTDEERFKSTMQPEFFGNLPDETVVGIGVDERGLALIELQSNYVWEFFDLYTIRGWGANDEQLQVVVAATDGGSDTILSLFTDHGAEIIERLKYFAEELAAKQQALAASIDDDVGIADGDNLPAGWESAVSQTTGHVYYVNCKTGESTYERPRAPVTDDDSWTTLPDGWEEHVSREGHTYYFNVITGESTYDMPEATVRSAETRTPGVGEHSFVTDNELDQWPLPQGWEIRFSRSTGEKYYANDGTAESTFERPVPSLPPAEGGPFVANFTQDGALGLAFKRTQDPVSNTTQIVVDANKAEGGDVTDGGQLAAVHVRPNDVLYSVQGEPVSSGGAALEMPRVSQLISTAGRPLQLVFVRPVPDQDPASQSKPMAQQSLTAAQPKELQQHSEPSHQEDPWWVKEAAELGPPATPAKPPDSSSSASETPLTSEQSRTPVAAKQSPPTPAASSPSSAGHADARSARTSQHGLPAPEEDEPDTFPDLDIGVARAGKVGTTVLEAHTKDVLSLLLIEPLPNGNAGGSTSIASGSEDGTIRVWDFSTPGALPTNSATLQNHKGAVRALATFATQDNRWLVSGGCDKTVRLWKNDGVQWKWEQTLRGHTDDINTVAVVRSSSTANLLVSGGDDMSIRLWAVTDSVWQCVGMCRSRTLWVTAVQDLANGDDESLLAAADGDGGISVWSLESRSGASGLELEPKRKGALVGHKETIWALESFQWNGSTRLLASASADKTVQVWHRPRVQTDDDDENPPQESEFKSVIKFRGPVVRRSVNALAFIDFALDASMYTHTDWNVATETMVLGKLRLASGGDDGQVTVWALQYEWQFGMSFWNYNKVATIEIEGPTSAVHSLSVVGSQIAVGRSDGKVTLLPAPVDSTVADRKPAPKLQIASAPKLNPVGLVVPARANMASLASDDDDSNDSDDSDDGPLVPAGRTVPPTAAVAAAATPIKLKAVSPPRAVAAVPAKVPNRSLLAAVASSDEEDSDSSDDDDRPIAPTRAVPALSSPAAALTQAPSPKPALTVPDRASRVKVGEDDNDSDWDSDDDEELPIQATRPVPSAAREAPAAAPLPNNTPAAAPAAVVPDRSSLATVNGMSDDSSDTSSSSGDDEESSTAATEAMAARAARLASLDGQ